MRAAESLPAEPHSVATTTTIPPTSGVRSSTPRSPMLPDDRLIERVDWLLLHGSFADAVKLIDAQLRVAPEEPTLLALRHELSLRELQADPSVHDFDADPTTVVETLLDGI